MVTGGDEHARFSKLFEAYFDAQHTLIHRLHPEVIGHFDLCRLYYPALDFREFPAVWVKIQRNIKLAVGYGALFEVNASAFRKGWNTAYPGTEVFDVSHKWTYLELETDLRVTSPANIVPGWPIHIV